MSDHTKVYNPYIYADGVREPFTVASYSCRECDCEWPCEAMERTTMSSDAREAVARAIINAPCCSPVPKESCDDCELIATDAALAALAPIIAAEIRAWAERETKAWADTVSGDFLEGAEEAVKSLAGDADAIASRICGGSDA